jgi:hypothetical protein
MRKHYVLLCFSFAFANLIIAQQGQLIIKGNGKNLHLDHTVSPKEGIFSIGRLYNVHPKTIAAYNKLDMTKGLSLGQVIHIPLTDTNFSQKTSKGKPIYYHAGAKETLEKVSNANNKVALQKLRDWNKLANDNLTTGKDLVIGFLVTNGNSTATLPPVEKKEAAAKDTIVKQPTVKTNTDQNKTGVKEDKKKEETKKTETAVTKPPITPKDTIKEETRKTETAATAPQITTDMTGQGYFKSSFDQQVKANPLSKTETVTAGIFRMTNGPQETKYYLLIDGVPSGTVVRVINPENNKTIYAKVLGEMNGVRQNQGLNIRISNAAASTLNITDTDKFIVKINY